MDWLLSSLQNSRLLVVVLLVLSLPSCDIFDVNGENISPASSFPIVYVKRPVQALAEPIDPVNFVAGGDLYWRDAASASAEEINLTRSQTAGAGDVSSPEVSFDGTQVVFSMRRPADTSWNIWLLDVSTKKLTQVLADDDFDDLHPHFLVDGRIVFSSDRQKQNREHQSADQIEPFSYLDPKGRHQSNLLHVMNADGSALKQISFHVGHDRDVALLNSGKLMFNRWESSGRRNHFPIITMNPDGTAMETLYGAYSKGNSFLSPRQLENGNLIAIHAPVSGAHGGGALIEINVSEFGDLEDRVAFPAAGAVAQKQISLNSINSASGVSKFGRFISPYPVFDDSNRILVSWSASNKTEVNDLQLTEAIGATTSAVTKIIEGNPSYGIYIMDLDTKNLTPIVPASKGVIAYDAIAIQARTAPTQIDDAFSGIGGTLVENLKTAKEGLIHVRSVYDSDVNDLLAPSMMLATEGEVIAQTPSGPGDTRTMVADIAAIKSLAFYTVEQRPARFVRVTRSVGVPVGAGQDLVGETGGVMQQILGYSEVEADGSVLVKVPADTPVAISVLDAQGRAITNHSSWFQVRPGEVLECFGCHSPRRRASLNVNPIAGNHPIVQLGSALSNETMAKTRARESDNFDINNPRDLTSDITYSDVWVTDLGVAEAAAGMPVALGLPIDINYSLLSTAEPKNGVINFVDHIQPIFSAGAPTCVSCHDVGQNIPYLGNDLDSDGVLLSYKNLVKGALELDPINPVVNLKEGAYLTQRQLPYVLAGGPRDSSRNSYLTEILTGTDLRAARTYTGSDHSGYLNVSEMRLFIEWMDTGANYYNSPFGDDVVNIGTRDLSEVIDVVAAADFNEFKTTIKPILNNRCASCHKAIGNKSDNNQRIIASTLGNAVPSENTPTRFVLTGNDVGDYQAAMSFIENRATPASNSLIARPLSNGAVPEHPQISDGAGGFVPVLMNTDTDYTSLINWITP